MNARTPNFERSDFFLVFKEAMIRALAISAVSRQVVSSRLISTCSSSACGNYWYKIESDSFGAVAAVVGVHDSWMDQKVEGM